MESTVGAKTRDNQQMSKKNIIGIKEMEERSIRPNSQFLSRLVGHNSKINGSVPTATPVQIKDTDEAKHAVIADLKG